MGEPAGAAYLLRITANGQPLQALLNKQPVFTYVDGRSFPYCSPDHTWNVFYSPNFQDNNSGTNSYGVTTDPGQAYRYEWIIPGSKNDQVEVTLATASSTKAALSVVPSSSTFLPK